MKFVFVIRWEIGGFWIFAVIMITFFYFHVLGKLRSVITLNTTKIFIVTSERQFEHVGVALDYIQTLL